MNKMHIEFLMRKISIKVVEINYLNIFKKLNLRNILSFNRRKQTEKMRKLN